MIHTLCEAQTGRLAGRTGAGLCSQTFPEVGSWRFCLAVVTLALSKMDSVCISK